MASGGRPEYYYFPGGQFKGGAGSMANELSTVLYGYMNGRRGDASGGSSGSEGGISFFLTGDTGSYNHALRSPRKALF